MKSRLNTTCLIFAGALVASLALVPSVNANGELPVRMMAFAGNIDGGETTLFDIIVSEWTPEAERVDIIRALSEEGASALRGLLQENESRGRIAARSEIGIDLRYAYRTPTAGGSKIVLVADRPIEADELINVGVITRHWDTTVVVLELDEQGRGSGELMVAAEPQLSGDGELTFSNAVPNPVRLGNVRILD